MADTKISDLPPVVAPKDADELAVADGTNVSKKITRGQIVAGVQAGLDGKGQVNSVVAGTNIAVDATDPKNPVVSSTGGADTKDVKATADDTTADFLIGKITQDGGTPLAVVNVGGVKHLELPPVGAPGAHAATHREGGGDAVQLTQAQVDSLETDLAARALAVDLTAHTGDSDNPHAVTAAKAGADPVGSAAAVQTNLDTHKTSGDHDGRYLQTVEQDTAPTLGGDLVTGGYQINFTDGAGATFGYASNTTSDGVAMWHSVADTVFDPSDGGLQLLPGTFEHYGAVQYMPAYDADDGVVRNMAIKDGRLMVEDKPAPGWDVSDTSNGKYPLVTLAAWVPFDGVNPLQVTTTNAVAEGERLTFQFTAHVTNADNKVANIALSIGLDGAAPTAAGVSRTLSKQFSGNVDVSLSQAAPVGGWPAGTVFRGYARKTVSNDGSPVADGTIENHTLLVRSEAAGGGSAAPLTRPYTNIGEIADGGTATCGLSNDSVGRLEATTRLSVAAGATITISPNATDIAAIPAGMSATSTFYVNRANAAAAVNFGAGWGSINWALLNPTDGSTAQNPPPLVVAGGVIRVSIVVTPGSETTGSWS